MAHEVERMAYSAEKDPPWHGIGRAVREEEITSMGDGLRLAGCDWPVIPEPLYRQVDGNYQLLKEWKLTVRGTDQKALGVVGSRYSVLQNAAMFRWFDPFLEKKFVRFDAAGSLRGGKRVWVTCELLRDPIRITKNDVLVKYLSIASSHDGSLTTRVGYHLNRIVCSNTLNIAIRDERSRLIRVFHRGNPEQTLEDLRSTVDAIDGAFKAEAERYVELTRRSINREDLRKYITVVFNLKPEEERTRESRVEETVLDIFECTPGCQAPGAKGTWWGAYNAVTEYLTHARGRTPENRLDSVWFGVNAKTGERALDMALTLSK